MTNSSFCERCRTRDGHLCTADLPLFRELPEEVQESLCRYAVHRRHDKGSLLFLEGDPVNSIRIIEAGRVKLCRIDSDGQEYIMDVLSDGNSIWESLFVEDAVFTYSAVCLTDVSVCEISKDVFFGELDRHPGIERYLIALLSKRLEAAKEKALLLSIRSPRVRVAGFLLDRIRRFPEPEIHLKLDEIAASISLRQETVSRVLRQFEKEEILQRLGQGRIRILSRDGLRRIFTSGDA